MGLGREHLMSLYQGTDYWPRRRAKRPSELHLPLLLRDVFDSKPPQQYKEYRGGNKIVLPLDKMSITRIAPILLHESLFNLYKAFYNYLAARNLMFGGMEHWIEVTLYYSKFFLARSLTTLVGRQSYYVSEGHYSFVPSIANGLIRDNGKIPKSYRIRLEVDVPAQSGSLIFDTDNVNSHKEVWRDYSELDTDALGVNSLLLITQGQTYEYLSKERNQENYSFDGYMQMDFNLEMGPFEQYFERDEVKRKSHSLYELMTVEVLATFCDQYQLVTSLGVDNLPLELEKFEHMIKYCLPESPVRDHLLMLCKEGFPRFEVYSEDGIDFVDGQDRSL